MRCSRNPIFGLLFPLFLFTLLFSFTTLTPAQVSAAQDLSADEELMVRLINQARLEAGKDALEVDPVLSDLARIKIQSSASGSDYYGYKRSSSTVNSIYEHIRTAGISYRSAVEISIRASSVERAYQGLCTLDDRANFLSTSYDRIGVGVSGKSNQKEIVLVFIGSEKIFSPTPEPEPVTPSAPEQKIVNDLQADEQKMLDLVNQERIKAGLQPLEADLELVRLARLKAQDMIDNSYFAHTSPTYGSAFDMMQAAGVHYRYAGENLAGAESVLSAHTNLMNSSGHRANILNANYTRVGIGSVSGGPYGKTFVQMFNG